MKRFFSKRQRNILRLVAGNICQNCSKPLSDSFHADHINPFTLGGKTILKNGQALCPECNSSKGTKYMNKKLKLRNWQNEAIQKSLYWLTQKKINKHFIINAAPGAGKTICASVIARELISSGEIERVIVIAPRTEVVRQWSEEYLHVTGRHMSRITGVDIEFENYGVDLCSSWAAISNLKDGFQKVWEMICECFGQIFAPFWGVLVMTAA